MASFLGGAACSAPWAAWPTLTSAPTLGSYEALREVDRVVHDAHQAIPPYMRDVSSAAASSTTTTAGGSISFWLVCSRAFAVELALGMGLEVRRPRLLGRRRRRHVLRFRQLSGPWFEFDAPIPNTVSEFDRDLTGVDFDWVCRRLPVFRTLSADRRRAQATWDAFIENN